MKDCEQTKGQSVLQHGISVKNYTFDLINHLRFGRPLKYEWKLPDCIYEHKDLILSDLPSDKVLKYYTILHDCGKPYCLKIDDEGRRHFPNHANVSAYVYSQLFDKSDFSKEMTSQDSMVSHLIKHDMDIHLLKSNGVEEFCEIPYCLTLLLVGLAEIHSNSTMFGGFDSTSFKVKWKSINQRGKQIIKNINKK